MLSVELNDLEHFCGTTIGHSPWKTVTQEMIQAFADATGDHQWIHLDVERATRETPWKSPVAHGFLTASLIPLLNQEVIDVQGKGASINYGINKLRFPAAVKSGADIRSKMELLWRGQACLRGREPGDVRGLIGQTPEATQKKGPLGPFSHSDGC